MGKLLLILLVGIVLAPLTLSFGPIGYGILAFGLCLAGSLGKEPPAQ